MDRPEVFPIVDCSDLPATCRWYERVLSGRPACCFPEVGEPDHLTLRRFAYLRDPEGTMLLVVRLTGPPPADGCPPSRGCRAVCLEWRACRQT